MAAGFQRDGRPTAGYRPPLLAGDVRKRLGSFPIVHRRCLDQFRNFRFVPGV